MKKIVLIFALLLTNTFFISTSTIEAEDLGANYSKIILQEDLVLEENNTGLTITGYNGPSVSGEIVIPEEIEGVAVTKIGHHAFKEKGLEGKLVLSDSVEIIDSQAFDGNKLTEVDLGGTQTAYYFAFQNNNIRKVTANNLKYVGESLFLSNNIEIVNLPSVEVIRQNAFNNNNVKNLFAPKLDVIEASAFEGQALTNLDLPSVKEVGARAFFGNKIETIALPQVKHIGAKAFEKNALRSVSLSQVEFVEEAAFYENNLVSINLPNVKKIDKHAFAFNHLSEDARLYPNTAEVAENSFGNNSTVLTDGIFNYEKNESGYIIVGLSSGAKLPENRIELPTTFSNENVIGIGEGAFQNKDISQKVVIPKGYEKIGKWAFKNNAISSLEIEGNTIIGEGAFEKNNLNSIILPEVKIIEDWAFEGNNLNYVIVPKLNRVGDMAFSTYDYVNAVKNGLNTNKIETLHAPELEVIGESAFANNKIHTITVPKASVIKSAAFYGNAFKTIDLFKQPIEIGDNVFPSGEAKYYGLFAVNINNSELSNEIKIEKGLIYNPGNVNAETSHLEFKKLYTQALGEYLDEELLENPNKRFIWRRYEDLDGQTPLIKASAVHKDENGNLIIEDYYCVDLEEPVYTGVYDIISEVEKVYVIEHTHYDGDEKLSSKKLSFNEEPQEDYKYSYNTSLLSKIIYHIHEMDEEGFDMQLETDGSSMLTHVVDSNPQIQKGVHLTSENVVDEIKDTDMYQSLTKRGSAGYAFDEATINELFTRVKNDNRDYTASSYAVWAGGDDIYYATSSQIIMTPGKPMASEDEEPPVPNEPPVEPPVPSEPPVEPPVPNEPPVEPPVPNEPPVEPPVPNEPTVKPPVPSEPTDKESQAVEGSPLPQTGQSSFMLREMIAGAMLLSGVIIKKRKS